MSTTTVTNDEGRTFTIRIVRNGDNYGRNWCLTHDDDDALVEFYDLTYADEKDPLGQFASRYYASTLIEDQDRLTNLGLGLDGGAPEWDIDGDTMGQVMLFVNASLSVEEMA